MLTLITLTACCNNKTNDDEGFAIQETYQNENTYSQNDISADMYVAGYCNVTAAIDGVQFSMSSGNIDAGTIKLYGVT